jgi:hypothetical protein
MTDRSKHGDAPRTAMRAEWGFTQQLKDHVERPPLHALSDRRGRGCWHARSDLRGNSLTGALPTEMGMLTSLTALLVGSQCLNGPLPTELGMLSRLSLLCVRPPPPPPPGPHHTHTHTHTHTPVLAFRILFLHLSY